MSLPDRQQRILDQIELALQSADPALRSMYAMFGRLTAPETMPAIEALPGQGAAGSAGVGDSAGASQADRTGEASRAGEADGVGKISGVGEVGGVGEAEATAATAGAMGQAAATGATGQAAAAGARRRSGSSWIVVGTVGPMASKAGIASTAASRRKARRILVLSVIVFGLLGLMIFGITSTSSQCPGLPSDQAVASAAVRYAACNHSTDAWSKGAR